MIKKEKSSWQYEKEYNKNGARYTRGLCLHGAIARDKDSLFSSCVSVVITFSSFPPLSPPPS